VDEVDGKRMWEEELEGSQGEELLEDGAYFEGSLEAGAEGEIVESGNVVGWVLWKAGLGD